MKAELIDHMGSDLTIVNAARVSFDKESDWEFIEEFPKDEYPRPPDKEYLFAGFGKIKLSEKDQKLIKYLATHDHWTPFSHVQITMRETVPIFVARQRFKHVVGFTYNEVSRRYVDDEPDFFVPQQWRKRAENIKQGSSDEAIEYMQVDGFDDIDITNEYKWVLTYAMDVYNAMLKAGVAPEQARMVLPQSMYTSYYTTGSLAAWARAYKLRIDPHAQYEIRELAKQWDEIIRGIPELKYSWEALIKN